MATQYITEFVMVQPNMTASTNTKRQINTHIARVSHSRSRKLRVKDYQDSVRMTSEAHVTECPTALPSVTWEINPNATRRHEEALKRVPRSVTPFVPATKDMVPFGNLLSTFAPREQFMLHYYASEVLPYVNTHCAIMESLQQEHPWYKENWIFHASGDRDYFKGFVLLASRHLSMVRQERQYNYLAVQYKLWYIREQRANLSINHPAAARRAVTMSLILGFDELMLGDLNMAFKHIVGAGEIIREAGGHQNLGLSKFIRYVLYHCLYGDRLESWHFLVHCSNSFMRPYLALPLINDS